jgi:hypothetical protein
MNRKTFLVYSFPGPGRNCDEFLTDWEELPPRLEPPRTFEGMAELIPASAPQFSEPDFVEIWEGGELRETIFPATGEGGTRWRK